MVQFECPRHPNPSVSSISFSQIIQLTKVTKLMRRPTNPTLMTPRLHLRLPRSDFISQYKFDKPVPKPDIFYGDYNKSSLKRWALGCATTQRVSHNQVTLMNLPVFFHGKWTCLLTSMKYQIIPKPQCNKFSQRSPPLWSMQKQHLVMPRYVLGVNTRSSRGP